MGNTALQTCYRSVVIAKLLYASWAWSGFASAADRQRIFAFIRRDLRGGLCSTDLPSISDLSDTADNQLFNNILANPNHVLYGLLPPASCATKYYNLRTKAHNRQ